MEYVTTKFWVGTKQLLKSVAAVRHELMTETLHRLIVAEAEKVGLPASLIRACTPDQDTVTGGSNEQADRRTGMDV